MTWLSLAFGAAMVWGLVNLCDKAVVDHEVKDGLVAALCCGIPGSAVLGGASFLVGSPRQLVPGGLLLGPAYLLSLWLYYEGMNREEVSRFVPTLSVDTVIVAVLSFIFLGERLAPIDYAGILSVVAGAIVLSTDDISLSKDFLSSPKALGLALLAATAFAGRDVGLKLLSSSAGYPSLLASLGAGGVATGLVLLLLRIERFRTFSSRGEEHLVGIGVLSGVGYVLFAIAIESGPVSLSSAVVKSKNIVVLAGSLGIEAFSSATLNESLGAADILQKASGTGLIAAGLAAIQVL